MQFEEHLSLRAPPEVVWGRVSNIVEIPRYWHGTKSLEIVGAEGDASRARIRFAFGGSGEARISVDEGKKTLKIEYVSGPFKGEQVVSVRGDGLTASWDVRFSGAFRLVSRWNESHFRSGTIHALERLAAERPPSGAE
jgi:Polyketide cyclase / dehydrase and lipid transport